MKDRYEKKIKNLKGTGRQIVEEKLFKGKNFAAMSFPPLSTKQISSIFEEIYYKNLKKTRKK